MAPLQLLKTLRRTNALTLARTPSSMVIATLVWLMTAILHGMANIHALGLSQHQCGKRQTGNHFCTWCIANSHE